MANTFLSDFDPCSPHNAEAGLFGIPTNYAESRICIIPVPVDVTTSYRGGAALGPDHVLQASPQLDLYDPIWRDAWREGFHLLETSSKALEIQNQARPIAEKVMHEPLSESEVLKNVSQVNKLTNELHELVYQQAKSALDAGKLCAVLGGDHSAPLGLMRALIERCEFGILHIDAHADLRVAYHGFEHSHASIMHNALEIGVKSLVQVGIRDYSVEEAERISSDAKITTFFDTNIRERIFAGGSWKAECDRILEALPENVYISFDIDGLDPALCPDTGTPVPGGLSYNEAAYLIKALAASSKKIVGFDLCEVAPSSNKENEWNGNVGARILFQMCSALVSS